MDSKLPATTTSKAEAVDSEAMCETGELAPDETEAEFSEALFDAIQDSFPIPWAVCSCEGTILKCNGAFSKCFNHVDGSVGGLVGSSIETLLVEEDVASTFGALESGYVEPFRVRIKPEFMAAISTIAVDMIISLTSSGASLPMCYQLKLAPCV